jgi:hypothetical protein
MSEYVKLAASAGDQFLSALSESQEQFLKNFSTFASYAPKAADMPMPEFAGELPTPKEIADANFAFAKKLLKQQKDFADKFFAASTPASS